MNRRKMMQALSSHPEWDICIIGGGATGLGIAVDAASRGLSTVLFEKYDFAKGTSSRSTKLVHGGVRYLAQGNIRLVLDALTERGLMMKNAPHLVKNQSCIIPYYAWWEYPLYGIGLKAYDWMAGSLGLGPSEILSIEETLQAAPTLDAEGLRGGIRYHDGQFDDARMAIHLAMTAADHGAMVLNYFPVEQFLKADHRIRGVVVKDELTGARYEIKAKAVINATGVFTDAIRQMDDGTVSAIVSPSQGIHLVLDESFLPSGTAIMIPRTDDGRVLFAVPWHHKLIIGTTDTPVDQAEVEPRATAAEIDFILQHIGQYLLKPPSYEDIRSIFCGLRPLVKGHAKDTSDLSRDHVIVISDSQLITVTGGKWTTYRKMAEDTVDVAVRKAGLLAPPSRTKDLPIHGYAEQTDFDAPRYYYGSDNMKLDQLIREDPVMGERIHPAFPNVKGEILWAVREEMCMTIEDFLARRSRMLFLDAAAAMEAAPTVASMMAGILQYDTLWASQQIEAFHLVAKNYLPTPNP